jgi:hypothetical protein
VTQDTPTNTDETQRIRVRLSAHGSLERVHLDDAGQVGDSLEVVILAEGRANDLYFGAPALAAGYERFSGAPVFVDHATLPDLHRPGGRSVRDLAGLILEPTWDAAARCIRGRLALSRGAAWLRELIRDFAPYPELFGLSADLWVRRQEAAAPPYPVLAIEDVNSVDIVIRPAAGGRFVTPGMPHHAKEGVMQNQTSPLVPCSPGDTPQEPQPLLRVQTARHIEPPVEPDPDASGEPLQISREQVIELALGRSALPEGLKYLIRCDRSLESLPEVNAAIARVSAAWAEATAQRAIQGLGEVGQMRTPLDRITLAFERLMGAGGEPGAWNRGDTAAHRAAPRLSGIREMYDLLTGDWERYGVYRPERVTLANATTTTMIEVVRNVLNKVMLQAYEARPHWWAPIVYEEDFTTLNDTRWITLGGFDDLDTVSEGDPYTEIEWEDYAEVAPFVKKGNYLGLTLEMIDRDDVGAVRAIPRRLGHAAWRTLSGAVAELFTANGGVGPDLADEDPLFDAAHGNLGSSALEATAWHATVGAMFKQAELGSGKRLGVRPSFCLVPIELEKTAVSLFTTTLEPGLAGNTRAIQQVSHSVITVPEWTDANDWAAVAHPQELPGVVIGYRFARSPELFIADHPLMGAMFTNDELRIKVRFVYAVGIGDYRALYKHIVASQ